MTASERAALEALAVTIEDGSARWSEAATLNRAGRSGDALNAQADAAKEMRGFAIALRALLSSPPPAEGDRIVMGEHLTEPPPVGANYWSFDLPPAEPPASDERPSDPPRVCAMDGLTYEEHIARGLDTDTDEHGPWRPRAAAPAPDEGRPQEKKLTSEASLTVREPPDQGPMPTGCDGTDRVAVCLRCSRRFDAHPRAKDANCAGFVDDPAAPCLACGRPYEKHQGLEGSVCPVEWSPHGFQAPAAYYCENRRCAWRGYDKPRERRCPTCGATVWKDGTAGHKPRPALPRDWTRPAPSPSPREAERCVSCDEFHGRVFGDCRLANRTVQPTSPACDLYARAPSPRSDGPEGEP